MLKHISLEDRVVLAQKCQISDAYLYQILSGRREASAELSVLIEQNSGKRFTRQMLRPKDWARVWPELAALHTVA